MDRLYIIQTLVPFHRAQVFIYSEPAASTHSPGRQTSYIYPTSKAIEEFHSFYQREYKGSLYSLCFYSLCPTLSTKVSYYNSHLGVASVLQAYNMLATTVPALPFCSIGKADDT